MRSKPNFRKVNHFFLFSFCLSKVGNFCSRLPEFPVALLWPSAKFAKILASIGAGNILRRWGFSLRHRTHRSQPSGSPGGGGAGVGAGSSGQQQLEMLTKCGKCVYNRQREKQPTTSGSGSHSGSAQSTVATGGDESRTTSGKRGAARAVAQQRKRKESVVSVLSAPSGLEQVGSGTSSCGRLRKKSATTLIGTSDEVVDDDETGRSGAVVGGGYRKLKSHGQKCKSLSVSLDLASDHDLFGYVVLFVSPQFPPLLVVICCL